MIKHAVLALLVARRGYGYDLVQRLGALAGPAWQLNPSAVYSALDQLDHEGLIRGARASSGASARRAGRVVYEPTPEGLNAYRAWVGRPAARREPIRSELALKVALVSAADVPALLEAVEHEAWLAQRLCDACLAEVSGAAHTGEWPVAATSLLRAAAVTRLRGELAWMDAVRTALEARLAGSVVPLPDLA